jgi:hypothetical protein
MIKRRLHRKTGFWAVLAWLAGVLPAAGDWPEYGANPYAFPIADEIWGYFSSFFTVDLNGDGLMDFTYRSKTAVYAYDHWGVFLWSASLPYPGVTINNHAAKYGAADVDGDGGVEIVAIDNRNRVVVLDGATGVQEDVFTVDVGANQIAGHVAVANLRGLGDRDVIVQTIDNNAEGTVNYYINRTLIAYRLDTHGQLWRVEQDRSQANGWYEGYWGPGHGPFAAADVDGDGRDEVVGGNLIDHDGTVVSLGYPAAWVGKSPDGDSYLDHFDAVLIGDFRPDRAGLEWLVLEENNVDNPPDYDRTYRTALMSRTGIVWRTETTAFPPPVPQYYRKIYEPQNVAAGNFTRNSDWAEAWLSSRGPIDNLDHQHPWVLDAAGTTVAHYNIGSALPAGFNPRGNAEGVEPACAIDWFGLPTEQIACLARHANGNLGVLDPMTGSAYWSTAGASPAMEATLLYVADVAGDSREEVVTYDSTDFKLKIYWNGEPNANQPKPSKWSDPLYVRLKQNWNYYQPGSYTYGDYPLISGIRVEDAGTDSAVVRWETDAAATSQVAYGPTASYGDTTVVDTAKVTSHRVVLSGLTPYAEIHFRVFSKNRWNRLGLSADGTFRTAAVYLSLNVFLEGPYRSASDSMDAALTRSGFLPVVSPYAEAPDTASVLPPDAVDWILVQLRESPTGPAVLSRSLILLSDGSAVDPDSLAGPVPLRMDPGSFHVVARHRNHLAAMTAAPVFLSDTTAGPADLSGEGGAYGTAAMKPLRTGLYGLWAGDVNGDGRTTTLDYTAWYNAARAGAAGYLPEDANLDGRATTLDYTAWYNNARVGAATRVP